jgi:hypothetical protein
MGPAQGLPVQGLYAIVGSNYSGSTLLNAMMNAHSRVGGGGELCWFLERGPAPLCGICGESCRHWTPEVRKGITSRTLYPTVSRLFGKPFVVDASKWPEWFFKMLPVYQSGATSRMPDWYHRMGPLRPSERTCIVLLSKHPIRLVSSYVYRARYYPQRVKYTQYADIPHTLATLRKLYEQSAKKLPITHFVKYEELVLSPERILGQLFGSFDLPFEPGVLNWRQSDQHFIGGNGGPRFQIDRRLTPGGTRKQKYAGDSLFLDESYKEILTEQEIEAVCRSDDAKALFDMFGYDADPGTPSG